MDMNGEMEADKPGEKGVGRKKELTWREVLMAAVPQKITDWAQMIMTLMRPWSESDNLKWKMIKAQAENPQNEKYYNLDEHMATIRLPEESMMLTVTTDSTKVAEPPPGDNT